MSGVPRYAATSRRLGRILTYVLALLIPAVIAAWYVTRVRGSVEIEPAQALVFAGAFFMTKLVCTRLPQGDEVCIDAMVGLTALGLLPIELALVAVGASGLLIFAMRFSKDSSTQRLLRLADIARRVAVIGVLAPSQLIDLPLSGDLIFVPVLAVGLAYVVLDVGTVGLLQRVVTSGMGPSGLLSIFRPLASVYMVHIAMAAVVLRVFDVLGLWAFGIALLLTLILQNGFNLYLRIRRAYAETIGALAQAAELDRPADTGHAHRVADLSVAVGRRLGVSSHDLEQIDYAALLHDVGRIGHEGDAPAADHADRGAEIVASIPFLEDVAPLIARHHETEGREDDPLPVGAAIVGVCSDYDRLRAQHGAGRALDVLRARESGLRLRVVDELSEVLVNLTARTRVLP